MIEELGLLFGLGHSLIRFCIFVFLVGFYFSSVQATVKTKIQPRASEPGATIRKAQEFILKMDRNAALDVLEKALLKPQKRATYLELQNAFHKIGEVFVSESGQQAYEFANVLRQDQPQQAKVKYMEALKIEGENLLILGGLVRLMVAQGECSEGRRWAEKIKKRYLKSERVALLLAYTAVCDGDLAELNALLKSPTGKFLPEEYQKIYGYEGKVGQGSATEFLPESPSTRKLQPLQWRIQLYLPDEHGKKLAIMDRYLEFCRKHEREVLEDWYYDPRLCGDLDEVAKLRVSEEQRLLKEKANP